MTQLYSATKTATPREIDEKNCNMRRRYENLGIGAGYALGISAGMKLSPAIFHASNGIGDGEFLVTLLLSSVFFGTMAGCVGLVTGHKIYNKKIEDNGDVSKSLPKPENKGLLERMVE